MADNISTTNVIDTLWYTRVAQCQHRLGLASQLGWFNEEFGSEGVAIKTLQETSDPNVRESHYDHHLINSFRQGGNVPAIWAKAQGADTRVIGLNWIDEVQLILTLPNSGIKSPADLRGRRLALPKHNNTIDHARAGALRAFTATLELNGISESDVEFVDIEINTERGGPVTAGQRSGGGYKALVSALQSKTVDAIFLKGSHGVETAEQIGAHIVYDLRSNPDPLVRANNGAPRPITVDSVLLRNRPDIVGRFLARIVAIGDWSAVHAAETVAYVARETGSSEAAVKKAYGDDLHLHQRTDLAKARSLAWKPIKTFCCSAAS